MNQSINFSSYDGNDVNTNPGSPFAGDPYYNGRREETLAKQEERRRLIAKRVEENGYIELRSDYYGTDKYFYDQKNKMLYKVNPHASWWETSAEPVFKLTYDPHILELNNIVPSMNGRVDNEMEKRIRNGLFLADPRSMNGMFNNEMHNPGHPTY